MHQFLIECINKNTTTMKRIIVRLEEIVLIIPLKSTARCNLISVRV